MTRELAEDGYSGVEVRVTPTKTEIIIMATRPQIVLGEKGRRIRELTSVVQKRFDFPENSVALYTEKVATHGLCAIDQAESLPTGKMGPNKPLPDHVSIVEPKDEHVPANPIIDDATGFSGDIAPIFSNNQSSSVFKVGLCNLFFNII